MNDPRHSNEEGGALQKSFKVDSLSYDNYYEITSS